MPYLAKSEPSTYSLADLKRDKVTTWDGVRNFQARNTLRQMKAGDQVLFYHSGDDKAVMGVMTVTQSAFPDPKATDGDWVAVGVKFVEEFATPITLATLKAHPKLKNLPLIRQSRLSVMPISDAEFNLICKLGNNS